MTALSLLPRALAADRLDLAFRPDRRYAVEIVERPGRGPPDRLAAVQSACREVVARCLGGRQLDYGLFAAGSTAWERSVVTLVRRAEDGRPVAFNAMPLMAVTAGAEEIELLHLGLVMVDPGERQAGLSWILYGLSCFLLFLRGRLRPLWVSSVTQVPAVVGMVAETFDQVWPGQPGTPRSFRHQHLARQIMARHRDAFGVGPDAGWDGERGVITDAYTGGSDHLKKRFAEAASHRDDRYNRFCAEALDYDRGDDVLQIGQLGFGATRRFLTRQVPRAALPQLLAQLAVLGVQALVAPTVQWLSAGRSLGRLRAAR